VTIYDEKYEYEYKNTSVVRVIEIHVYSMETHSIESFDASSDLIKSFVDENCSCSNQ